MDFRLLPPHWLQDIDFRLAGPHIRFKKLRNVSSYHPLPSCCNSAGSILLFLFSCELSSSCLWLFGPTIFLILGQDRPDNSGILVRNSYGDYIWVPPLTHLINPDASGILFAACLSKNGSGPVDQKCTKILLRMPLSEPTRNFALLLVTDGMRCWLPCGDGSGIFKVGHF